MILRTILTISYGKRSLSELMATLIMFALADLNLNPILEGS